MTTYRLMLGDCLERMRELPDASVDALVCDPPYGLSNQPPAAVMDCLLAWASGLPYHDGTPRKGPKNCAGTLCGCGPAGDSLDGDPDAGEVFITFPISTGTGGMFRPVNLNNKANGREIKINGERPPWRSKNLLVDKGESDHVKTVDCREFILRKRKIGPDCIGVCSCLTELGQGAWGIIVWLRDYSFSEPDGPSSIVASPGTECRAVLTLDLRRGTADLHPAEGTLDFDTFVELVCPEKIGAITGAGGLPSPLEPPGVGDVGFAANWTLSIHRNLLERLNNPTIPHGGFMSRTWDSWVPGPEVWRECFRVMKPGAHLVAFAGSRTSDLMGMAIRLAGFEIRDNLYWIHGQGFPKSRNISKDIDAAAGAEREVVGRGASSCPDLAAGRPCTCGEKYGKERAQSGQTVHSPETAPATPEAQQWDGFGTSLKPAVEPMILARRPLIGTVAQNVLALGTGGLNIDATRVGTSDNLNGGTYSGDFRHTDARTSSDSVDGAKQLSRLNRGIGEFKQPAGRWPPHLLLSHSPGCKLVGTKRVKGSCDPRRKDGTVNSGGMFGAGVQKRGDEVRLCDADGLETVEEWRCEQFCPVRILGEQSGELTSGSRDLVGYHRKDPGVVNFGGGADKVSYSGDTGNASRFFPCFPPDEPGWIYQSKPSRAERDAGIRGPRNTHCTVKSLSLMRWLCKLITPPGGTVLDPFLGSGSTGCAALMEEFNFIGIEQSEEYLEIARQRIAYWAPMWAREVSDSA